MKLNNFSLVILFVVFISLNTKGQYEPCDYIPLELSGIEPIWTHTMRDTSIIGYVHEGADNNTEFAFQDGYNHLVWDKYLTVLEDGFAYLFVELVSDQDEYGSLIEKIDLNTGDMAWQYSIDPRTDTTFHSIQSVDIVDNNLIVQGLRPVVRPTFGYFAFSTGYYNSYYFRKVFDIESGELIDHATPVTGDSLAFISPHWPYRDHYDFLGTEVEHLELTVYDASGVSVVRNYLDTNGNMISSFDTVAVSNYYDVWDQSVGSNESWRGKFIKEHNNSYYLVHEFIPSNTTTIPLGAELVNYDSDFNVISSVDLTQYVFDDFKAIGIHSIDEDKIVLRGCLEIPPICKEFYYVLDREYNLLDYFISEKDGENVYGKVFISNENQNYVIDKVNNEIGHSTVTLSVSNHNNTLDTVKNMEIIEPNWAAIINFYTQLDNGDWIIKWSHGCWGDGVYGSFFHELWRISAEDFEVMVGILDREKTNQSLSISPNPSSNVIRFDLDITLVERIVVYDSKGQLIDVYRELRHGELDISGLANGMYHLKIDLKDGSVQNGRFVKY